MYEMTRAKNGKPSKIIQTRTMATCSTVRQNSLLPCNEKPHKEPSAFAETLQMLCGMRTGYHG